MLTAAATQQLRQNLADLPELLVHAELAILPAGGTRSSHVTGATRTAPLPVRADVLSLLGPAAPAAVRDEYGDQNGPAPIPALIADWARLVVAESQPHLTEASHQSLSTRTLGDQIRTLQATADWAARQPWARDYAAEIHQAVRQLSPLAVLRARRQPAPIPCPRCTELTVVNVDGRDPECTRCGLILRPAEYQDHASRHLEELYAIDTPDAVHRTGQPDPHEDTPMNETLAPGTMIATHLHGVPGAGSWTVAGTSTVLDITGTTVLLSVRGHGGNGHLYATGTPTPLTRGSGWCVTSPVTTGMRAARLTLTTVRGQLGTPETLARAVSTALDALAPHLAAASTGPLTAAGIPAAAAAAQIAAATREIADTALAERNDVIRRLIDGGVQPTELRAPTGLSKSSLSAIYNSRAGHSDQERHSA